MKLRDLLRYLTYGSTIGLFKSEILSLKKPSLIGFYLYQERNTIEKELMNYNIIRFSVDGDYLMIILEEREVVE